MSSPDVLARSDVADLLGDAVTFDQRMPPPRHPVIAQLLALRAQVDALLATVQAAGMGGPSDALGNADAPAAAGVPEVFMQRRRG